MRYSLLLVAFFFACGNRDFRISKAREFIRKWDWGRAQIELEPFKKKPDAEALYLLGQCAIGKNTFDDAHRFFKSAMAIDTSYIDSVDQVYKSLIQKSMRVNDADRAAFFFDQILSLSPRPFFEPSFLNLMGDIYWDRQEYAKAALTYETSLKVDSTSPAAKEVMTKLIDAYEKSNNLKKALALVEIRYAKTKSSLLLMRLGKYYFDIGIGYFQEKTMDTAQSYLMKIVESNAPQSLVDDSYFYLGEISFDQGDFARAKTYYEKVLHLNPYRKGTLVEKAKQRLEDIKGKG